MEVIEKTYYNEVITGGCDMKKLLLVLTILAAGSLIISKKSHRRLHEL